MAASLDRLLLMLLLATPLLSQVATTADSSTITPCIEKGDMKECVNATIVQPEGKSVTFDKEDLQQDVIDRWTASKTELTGGFIIKASKYIKHLKFPKLEKIKYLTIEHLVNLETIELPVLKSVSVGLVILGNPSLKTIYINPKAVGGTLSIGGNGQLDQTSIAKWNMLKMDNTSHVQEFGECSSDILYSTSELAHCSLLNFHCLGNAGNVTIEGGMPEGVKEEGIEVSCVTFDKTNLTTLAFVKVGGTKKNNRNVLTNNPLLCDEGLVEKFNVTARQPAWKHYIHSNCDAICDTHELHNPADADQLIKCTIFRDNKSPIGEEQLNNKMPQVTHIQGKVELHGTNLKDLSLLQNIQEIDSKHDLALEIVDNKELDQIDLPKLKTLKSNGSVKLRIRGNKKLLDKDEYEKLKKQLSLEDEDMETDYVVPTTTAEASSLPFASGLGSSKINGSSSTGKKVAIVIGIVIVLLMLLALVGSLVYWFVIKKKLQKKKAQEEKKDGEKKVQRSLKQTTKSVEQTSKSGLARGEVMNTIGKSTEQANNKTA